jgi:hypothetical protein
MPVETHRYGRGLSMRIILLSNPVRDGNPGCFEAVSKEAGFPV